MRISKRERAAGLAAAEQLVLSKPGYRQAAERLAATLESERTHYPKAAAEAEGLLSVARRPAPETRSG